MSQADSDIIAAIRTQFRAAPPSRLGVAVSGGGDSVALLHLLSQCFDPADVALFAATVDHGLRPGSAAEAQMVADLAASLNIPHETLHWTGWAGEGNLQNAARDGRYQLLGDWAGRHDIPALAVGHTADDQAETVLMRLGRSSGVTGLSAMPVRRSMHGVTVVRPMLALSRGELRAYLRRNDLRWAEDPSNEDTRFERIRIRQAMETLAPLGITVKALAGVAQNMAQAREALDWFGFLAARDIAWIDGGDVVFDLRGYRTLPEETARRLLVRALIWVSTSHYPPRRAAVAQALDAVRQGRASTLAGCVVTTDTSRVRVSREYNAVRALSCPVDAVWDRRWRVCGTGCADLQVRALGREGLSGCPDWRATQRPRTSLLASPSVWSGARLVSAPLAGFNGNDWQAELIGGEEAFFASLLSH